MDEETKKTLCRLVGDHVTLILKDAIQLERQAKRARFVSNNGNNGSSMNGNGSGSSDDKHTLMTTHYNSSSNKLGRRVLDVQDINHALIYRGIDPMFTTIHENSSNQRVDLNEFLTSEMQERVPTEISMSMHWLAVDGVQPQIPQNPTNIINNNIIHSNTHRKKKKKKKMNDDKDNDTTNNNNATIKDENEDDDEEEEDDNLDMEEDKEEEEDEMENGAVAGAGAASVRQLLPRLLSEELQLYFTRVTVAMERGTPPQQDAALLSVGRDAGTQELVPFFSRYISSQIYKNIGKPMYCCTLIRLAHALFTNPHLHMELHLHQILPAIITCVVAKRLSSSKHNHNNNHHADHWSLRKQAALALVQACIIFGNDYTTLRPRVVKTLCEAMGPDKPLTTQYGGIVGISLFGPKAVDAFILPIATIYWNKWEPVLQTIEDDNTDDNDHHHELKLELQQCQRALLDALATFFQDEDLMGHSKRFNLNALETAFGEKLVPLHNQTNPSVYLTCFI